MNKNLGLKGKLASLLLGAALVLIGMATSLLAPKAMNKLGGAIGLNSVRATSSRLELLADTNLILTATSTCSARTITTKASPILLSFYDQSTDFPTVSQGHIQAASTTVSYQAEEYGCGRWRARTVDGLGTFITLSEHQ